MNKSPVNSSLFLCFLFLIFLTGGCIQKSTPVYYYTLNTDSKTTFANLGEVPAIVIGPLSIASILDQGTLVSRKGSNAVTLSEQYRWAAPLPEIIQNIFIANISRQLNNPSVFSFPDAKVREGFRVEISIDHFEKSQQNTAVLAARYRILSIEDSRILLTKASHYSVPLQENTVEAQVQGLNNCLTQLSREISKQLLSLSSTNNRS